MMDAQMDSTTAALIYPGAGATGWTDGLMTQVRRHAREERPVRARLVALCELASSLCDLGRCYLSGLGTYRVKAAVGSGSRVLEVSLTQLQVADELQLACDALAQWCSDSRGLATRLSESWIRQGVQRIEALVAQVGVARQANVAVVRHMTLREWLFCRDRANDIVGTRVLLSSSRALSLDLEARFTSVDLTGTRWLEHVKRAYRDDRFPMRRSELFSLALDLATLYRAQLALAAKGVDALSAPFPLPEVSRAVRTTLNNWASEGVVRLPKTAEAYSDPAFWLTFVAESGTRLLNSGGGAGDMLPPLSFRQPLMDHYGLEAWSGRYSYCVSLEALADQLTLTHRHRRWPEPRVLVCRCHDRWLIFVGRSGSRVWEVASLSSLSTLSAVPAVHAAADSLFALDDLALTPVTTLSFWMTSGELYDTLIELSEQARGAGSTALYPHQSRVL